jgi:hypothetical protein
MTATRMIDCRLIPRRRRGFSGNDGGGGGGAGGVRWICWVGRASAGDGGLWILCVGPTSAGRYRARSCSVGGSGRLGGGGLRVGGPGGGIPLLRQSGCPGRCGGVTCAILPQVVATAEATGRRPAWKATTSVGLRTMARLRSEVRALEATRPRWFDRGVRSSLLHALGQRGIGLPQQRIPGNRRFGRVPSFDDIRLLKRHDFPSPNRALKQRGTS